MHNTEELAPMLDTAFKAVKEAGHYLMNQIGKIDFELVSEKAKNDFVSEVDRTSERIIIDTISRAFPGHQILAEESGLHSKESRIQWIIDPLDGTLNYLRGIPFFSISIAVKNASGMLIGVVYNPAQQEIFHAVKQGGAFLNRQPIAISNEKKFDRAFLATGFPHHAKFHLPQFIRAFSDIFFKCAGVRRLGSAAIDLCYTACGRFEGYWELGLKPWDLAAGSLIVREAGGTVSDFWGGDSFLNSGFIIAANNEIHQQLQNILSTYFIGESHE